MALGWEALGGDDDAQGKALRTPLASPHGFNGWADRFLTTPDAGLDVLYVVAKTSHGTWSGELLAATFDGTGSYEDVTKVWLMLTLER